MNKGAWCSGRHPVRIDGDRFEIGETKTVPGIGNTVTRLDEKRFQIRQGKRKKTITPDKMGEIGGTTYRVILN